MHTQGNTIDFDTARIKLGSSLKTNTARRAAVQQGAQFEQIQQKLLRNLQTTLEAKRKYRQVSTMSTSYDQQTLAGCRHSNHVVRNVNVDLSRNYF